MSIKESTADRFTFALPEYGFVAGDTRFVFGRLLHHAFHTAFFEVHQVAGSENASVAHPGGYMNFAVSKELAAFHRDIIAQGGLRMSGGAVVRLLGVD